MTGGYSVYVLDWTDRGGRQYVGLTRQPVGARVRYHARHGAQAVTDAWATHGEPRVEVLATGLTACDGANIERREIARRNVYNKRAGGDLGRPMAASGCGNQEQLNIRLSTADRAMLQRAADSKRLPLGAYIRMVAIEAAKRYERLFEVSS